MTLIAAMVVKGPPPMDSIYLASDSRVNFHTDSNKFSSYTDRGDKVIIVNENILIAYAGDYYRSNMVIEAMDVSEFNYRSDSYNNALKVCEHISYKWDSKYQDTSFFICIRDTRNNKWSLYNVDSHAFIPKPGSIGLNLIGMGKNEHEKFTQAFQKSIETISPPTIEGLYMIPISTAYQEIFNQDVNGILSFYILDLNGIRRTGIAINNDGENWVAYSPNQQGSTRFVTGKPYGSTSKDYKDIKTTANKEFNDPK